MLIQKFFSKKATLAYVLAIVAVVAACGGDESDAPPAASREGTAPQVKAAPAEVAAPAVTLPIRDESGLVLRDVILDAGQWGGSITAVLFNEADILCKGVVVNFDLLREDGSVAGRMGIMGYPLESGVEGDYKEKYIGAGVTQALPTNIGCDNSRAAHGDPQSPYKPDLEQKPAEDKSDE